MLALWAALADYLRSHHLDVAIGCCSAPVRGAGYTSAYRAAALWRRLGPMHMAEPAYRVRPRVPLPVDVFGDDLEAEVPPLLKAYLRMGAKLLGPPAWDPDFGCADLPVMLRLSDLPDRYRRHFLRDGPAPIRVSDRLAVNESQSTTSSTGQRVRAQAAASSRSRNIDCGCTSDQVASAVSR
jgi:putative hemolysin